MTSRTVFPMLRTLKLPMIGTRPPAYKEMLTKW